MTPQPRDQVLKKIEAGNFISITVALSVVGAVAAGSWQASNINTRLDEQVRAVQEQSREISSLRDTVFGMNTRLVRMETQMTEIQRAQDK